MPMQGHGKSGIAFTVDEVLEALRSGGPRRPLREELSPAADALVQGENLAAYMDTRFPEPEDLGVIPQTTYTLYREYARTGDRKLFEKPFFLKRHGLGLAVLLAAFADQNELDHVCDYVWDICEETNWVLPAHEQLSIDLFSAETGLILAETIRLLGERLPEEIVQRATDEIYRRVLEPFRAAPQDQPWYEGENNWNGVCCGSVGATSLHLEDDLEVLATDIASLLQSLDFFRDVAFCNDGTSTEGVGYWQYGLSFYVLFGELLRVRTGGAIDILAGEKMRKIARFPLYMMLSPGKFASFADSVETMSFTGGFLARLAERTDTPELPGLLNPEDSNRPAAARLPMALRALFWWNGQFTEPPAQASAFLPDGAIARLTATTCWNVPLVLMAKAGHNAEHHNQNDVSSFILHVAGDTLLCDPGRPEYTREYFSSQRYDNVYANSRGHSVPVVGGRLQSTGAEYSGEFTETDLEAGRLAIEFASAYDAAELTSLRRSWQLRHSGGRVAGLLITDAFELARATSIEEGLVSRLPMTCRGSELTITGERAQVVVSVSGLPDAVWATEPLEETPMQAGQERILHRACLAGLLPAGRTLVEMELEISAV